MSDETVFLALHNAAPRTVKVTRDGSGIRASLPATRRDPLVLIALVLLVLVLPLALLVCGVVASRSPPSCRASETCVLNRIDAPV